MTEYSWTDNLWDDDNKVCRRGRTTLSEGCILCGCKEGDGCPVWEDFIARTPEYNQVTAIEEAIEEYKGWDESGYFDINKED